MSRRMILAVSLVLTLALSLIPRGYTAVNAQALIVTVDTTTAALGDIVTVQVEIQNAVNLDS